jgi:quercetin dioxygenase-like cupin family protein
MGEPGSATPLVVRNDVAERHDITQVEGVPLDVAVTVRVLSEGGEMLVLEVTMPPGESSPPHVHDHDSVGYVVRGRASTVIDGITYELHAGDGFRHPPGIEHSMAALDEGAVWLEIKSPPTRTW